MFEADLGSEAGSSTTAMPESGGSSARQAAARTSSENATSSSLANTLLPSRRCSSTVSVRNTDADSRRMRSAASKDINNIITL